MKNTIKNIALVILVTMLIIMGGVVSCSILNTGHLFLGVISTMVFAYVLCKLYLYV